MFAEGIGNDTRDRGINKALENGGGFRFDWIRKGVGVLSAAPLILHNLAEREETGFLFYFCLFGSAGIKVVVCVLYVCVYAIDRETQWLVFQIKKKNTCHE